MVRGPKYTVPGEEAKRVKNLPPEKIRTPASKFSGRNNTEKFFDFSSMHETPVITNKMVLMITKQLTHSDYLQRMDALEKIGELAEKGADVDKLVPAVESASEDYSPYVSDYAKKVIAKIKEIKAKKAEMDINDTDPRVVFDGKSFGLYDALRDEKARPKAVEKLRIMAYKGISNRNHDIRFSILRQMEQIVNNKTLMNGLGRYVKNNIIRILYDLGNDRNSGIKSTARMLSNSI